MPGIHVLAGSQRSKDVDGRNKSGHDGDTYSVPQRPWTPAFAGMSRSQRTGEKARSEGRV